MLRPALTLVVLGACWTESAPPPVEPGPAEPAAEACPEHRFRELAQHAGATYQGSRLETVAIQLVGQHRCGALSDAECRAKARKSARIPRGSSISTIEVVEAGTVIAYEIEFTVNGVKQVQRTATMPQAVALAKQAQASGASVMVTRMEAIRDSDRRAEIHVIGPAATKRREGTLRVPASGEPAKDLARIQELAARDHMEVTAVEALDGDFVVRVTCDVSPPA